MKPILFNTKMVRAIQDGRKTVTRRGPFQLPDDYIVTGAYRDTKGRICALFQGSEDVRSVPAPYRPGDILYVRETWNMLPANERAGIPAVYWYRADIKKEDENPDDRWRPSVHMPKEAARIFLRVTGVRVERLQDITEDGAVSEGCMKWYEGTKLETEARSYFCDLWDSTIKPADLPLYGWEANPWVWVVEFERISRDEALKGGGE